MTTTDMLFESVCTLMTIEKNCDHLAQNLETLLDKHIEFSLEAETLQEQFDIRCAAFDSLIENLMEFLSAQKKLLVDNRKTCRGIIEQVVGASE